MGGWTELKNFFSDLWGIFSHGWFDNWIHLLALFRWSQHGLLESPKNGATNHSSTEELVWSKFAFKHFSLFVSKRIPTKSVVHHHCWFPLSANPQITMLVMGSMINPTLFILCMYMYIYIYIYIYIYTYHVYVFIWYPSCFCFSRLKSHYIDYIPARWHPWSDPVSPFIRFKTPPGPGVNLDR